MKQNGEEVEFGKRNRTKTKRFQDEVTTIPNNTNLWRKSQKKKRKNANSTSSSKSQKIKTSSKSKRWKGKKPSLPMMEAKKRIPKWGDEVFTDSEEEEELKVTTSKKKSSNYKKGKRKRGRPKGSRKRSDDSSSLKYRESNASRNLKKKEREVSNKKFVMDLNKLRGCFSSDNERSEKKKLMDLMTFLEGSTCSKLKEERDELDLNRGEIEDKFVRICEEFIDGNHPTKILHKSWNEKFVKIMGSISGTSLRRQQMVLNLLTSADLTDDQRSKVFNALETYTMKKLHFLELTEDLLPSCNPLEFDPDSLMKKADLKLRHNGISKSWNLITSASSPHHQFSKEEIMDYIDGDEGFDFLELYNGF